MRQTKPRRKRLYPNIIPAPLGRRVGSYFIDFILILVVGIVAYMGLDALYSQTEHGKAANQKLYTLRMNSGLYMQGQRSEYSTTYLDQDINSEEYDYEMIYLYRLEYFYTHGEEVEGVWQSLTGFSYLESTYYVEDTLFNYETMVLRLDASDSLFTLMPDGDGGEEVRFKSTLTAEERSAAWTEIYSKATKGFETSSLYISARKPIADFSVTYNPFISSFIGTILPWLVAPLLFGHGRSLGKFMLGLAVVNKDGYEVKTWQVVIRFLVFGLLETALNFPALAIPLLITSGVLAITHNHRAVHDLASGTYVIDAQKSLIFKHKDDEEEYFSLSREEQALNKKGFTEARKTLYFRPVKKD